MSVRLTEHGPAVRKDRYSCVHHRRKGLLFNHALALPSIPFLQPEDLLLGSRHGTEHFVGHGHGQLCGRPAPRGHQAPTPETAQKIQRSAAELEKTALTRVGMAGPGIGKLLDTFA